jgi:predicted nucleic acid-binding protein
MTTLCLVDNSVTQRLGTSATVLEAWNRLIAEFAVASCLPQILEEGYSARSLTTYGEIIRHNLESKVVLLPVPELLELAVDIQRRLFTAGRGRAVGVTDLQLAATALYYSNDDQTVEIVHYDSDFDHLAAFEPRLRTRWIVPRGTA